ncbi:MAG: hypothetical protein GY835_03025 [bacterium]|nr:hypothetical protein [bacterium]
MFPKIIWDNESRRLKRDEKRREHEGKIREHEKEIVTSLANREDVTENLKWLRDYKNHQESILYMRINIFIVVSAILIAGFVDVPIKDLLLRCSVASLGLGVTVLWIVVVLRQWTVTKHLRHFLLKLGNVDPLYRSMRAYRILRDEESFLTKRLSGETLLFLLLPGVFLLFWVFALYSSRSCWLEILSLL